MTRDIVVERLRALHFANDRCAGMVRKQCAGEQNHEPVTPDDFPVGVDSADPIRVAVVGNADARPNLLHARRERRQVLGNRRVRMMIGKTAIHLAEESIGFETELFHTRESERAP